METLISWARSNGASFEATPSEDHPRKLVAARDLSPGDVMFSIPECLLLYGARAYDDPEYSAAFRQLQEEAGPVLDQRSLLVLLLVLEKCRGQASFFAPYVDLLPPSYDDPFWWSGPELQLLQGTRLQKAVALYTTGLKQLHGWLVRLEQLQLQQLQQQQQQPMLQEEQQQQHCVGGTLSAAQDGWGLTLAAVKWARSAVWSRAFTIKGLDIGSNAINTKASSRGGSCPAANGSTAAGAMQEADRSAALPPCAAAAAAAGGDGEGDGDADAAFAPVIALVPVLDMCDHHSEQRVSWRTVVTEQQQQLEQEQQQQPPASSATQQAQQRQGKQAFQFTSLSPVVQGSELFNNYGTTKPNEELLLGFGFVLDQNPNDSFLVSISHPPQALCTQHSSSPPDHNNSNNDSSSSSEGGEGPDEAAVCDEAAVWQRRLAAMAALGLRLEVPMTAAEPLPVQLLDVMLLAAAMPAWRISTVLQSLPAAAPTAAGTASRNDGSAEAAALAAADASAADMLAAPQVAKPAAGITAAAAAAGDAHAPPETSQPGSHAQRQQSSQFAAAPLCEQLQALHLLRQQLTGKLQGMLPEQELLKLLQPCEQQQQQQGLSAGRALNPDHARLAAVYVLSQQRVLRASLPAVEHMVSTCLAQAASAVAAAASANPSIDASAGGLAGHVRLHEQLQSCPCCGVLSVNPASKEGIPAGSVLLQAGGDCCIAADSEAGLVMQLMAQAGGVGSTPDKQQGQQLSCTYFAQQWRQQQEKQKQEEHGGAVACVGADQLLPWWLVQDYQELVGALQDTPAGQQLLERSEELQDDFQCFVNGLQQAAAADAAGGTSSSMQQRRLLQHIQDQPQQAFRMFCWAQAVVQQAALPVQPAPSAGSRNQHTGKQQQVVLVPGLEHVPKVMMNAVMEASIIQQDVDDIPLSQPLGAHQQQEHQQQGGLAGCQVAVRCSCSLPAGLRLGPDTTAPGATTQQLLMECGPRALHAAARAASISAATAAGVADYAAADATGQDGVVGSCSSTSSSSSSVAVQHVYELMLAPPEDDALRQQKLQLLACTGTGLCHFLTCGASSAAIMQPQPEDTRGQAAAAVGGSDTDRRRDTTANCNSSLQRQGEAVLSAMALCLLSADDPAHAQLLQPAVLQRVEAEQQQLLQASGVLTAAAPGAHLPPGASSLGSLAEAAGAAGGAAGAGTAAVDGFDACSAVAPPAQAWANLQQQILQQTGKEARKQLLQALKEDRQAVRSAQKQLQTLMSASDPQDVNGAAAATAAASTCSCTCRSSASSMPSESRLSQAAAGVSVYLQGQLQVLDSWLGILQRSSSSKAVGGAKGTGKEKGKKKGSRGSNGSSSGAGKHKKAKHS